MSQGGVDTHALRSELRESATAIAAVLAAVGAIAYVLLAALCAYVYHPLGVSPSDVGLSYAELLSRAGTALAAIAAFGVAMWCAILGAARGLGRFDGRAARVAAAGVGIVGSGMVAVLMEVPLVVPAVIAAVPIVGAALGPDLRGVGLRRTFAAATVAAILVAPIPFAFSLVGAAIDDRARLQRGEVPGGLAFGLDPPWDATMARVAWVGPATAKPPDLSRCVLYLGKADATTLLHDARRDRTFRLPTAAVALEILPRRRTGCR